MKQETRAMQIEYLGFSSSDVARTYRLRVKDGAEFYAFTIDIAHQAFIDHRVRYQDGPDICFLRLQREIAGSTGGFAITHLTLSDVDLAEYREAHLPKPPQRRRQPPPVA